ILGFFALIDDNRTSSTGNNKIVYYCHYNTAIQCQDGTRILAKSQVYSPPSQTGPLPDGTVAFVMAKAIFPSSVSAQNPVAMFALQFMALPGDPIKTVMKYEHIPGQPHAWVYGLGHVAREPLTLNDARTR
ncbi:hypothetical protein C8J57DRAFT_970073, partial [Mycena rebaudengoi]